MDPALGAQVHPGRLAGVAFVVACLAAIGSVVLVLTAYLPSIRTDPASRRTTAWWLSSVYGMNDTEAVLIALLMAVSVVLAVLGLLTAARVRSRRRLALGALGMGVLVGTLIWTFTFTTVGPSGYTAPLPLRHTDPVLTAWGSEPVDDLPVDSARHRGAAPVVSSAG